MTDVRRPEEALRIGLDEHLLGSLFGRGPDREPAVAVVVVEHHQERALVSDEEGRMAVAQPFTRLGEREAELADAPEHPFAVHCQQTTLSAVKLALLAAATVSLVGASAPAPGFVGRISRVTSADLPHTYRPGCPVTPAQLRKLSVSHWDFRNRPHVGEIVVRATEATDVVAVFRKLFAAHFPIRRMRLVDAYRGSDDASMAADNTSGFNCRRVPGSSSWSAHAYGLAIDVNPVENPFIDRGKVEPPAARRYLDRANVRRGMAVRSNVLVKAFAAIGWSWGGLWSRPIDYQHFSATGG